MAAVLNIEKYHGKKFSEKRADAYVDYMAQYVGRENVYPMNIRSTGAVHVE